MTVASHYHGLKTALGAFKVKLTPLLGCSGVLMDLENGKKGRDVFL